MEIALSLPYGILLIVPPMVFSYIHKLLTSATVNQQSMFESTTAIAVLLIPRLVPQKVPDEVWGKAGARVISVSRPWG